MADYGTVERVIPTNRKVMLPRVIFLIVAWSALELLCAFVLPFMAVVMLAIFFLGFYRSLRGFVTGKAIVITNRGLLDYIGNAGFIPWADIAGARVKGALGLDQILLDLVDQEALLARFQPIDRLLWTNYIGNHGGSLYLHASYVEGGAEELIRLINGRANRSPSGRRLGDRPIAAPGG